MNGSRLVLFRSKKVCFGIFDYIADDGAVEFCLFDPNGRNTSGFYDYDADACITFFKKIEDLFALLARDDLFNHAICECIPMRTIPIPIGVSDMVFPFQPLTFSEHGDESDSSSAEDNLQIVKEYNDGSTRYGRKVGPAQKYECESHPSFWRGKERQDKQKMKRNKIVFVEPQTKEEITKYNAARRHYYQLKKEFPGYVVSRIKKKKM